MAEDLIKPLTTESPDPRTILHFKTLTKFNEKLSTGRVDPNKHFVVIHDERLFWVRGNFISDNGKLDGINEIYNNWTITLNNANTLTITLKGLKWNSNTRTWDTVEYPIDVNSATNAIAGLMSATDKAEHDRINTTNFGLTGITPSSTTLTINTERLNINTNTSENTNLILPSATQTSAGVQTAADKLKEDRITKTNHTISNPSTTTTSRTIKLTAINPTDNTDASSEITVPAATLSEAGLMSATDKKAVDNVVKSGWSHINDDNTFTSTTTDVNLNYTCRDGNMDTTADDMLHSAPIGAASSTRAGVMISQDKIELDRIDTSNFDITAVTPNATTVVVSATKTNITTGNPVDDTFIIPESTTTVAGTASALDKITTTNTRTIGTETHIKDTAFTATADKVTLNYENISSTTKDATVVAKNPELPMSSPTSAGLITAAEHVLLHTTIPENLTAEQARAEAAEKAITDNLNSEIAARKAVDGLSGKTYSANTNTNYIKNASSLNDADIKLDNLIKANADAISILNGNSSTSGSISKSIQDAITSLDSEITSTDGTNVLVKVKEVDGKITEVNITTDNTGTVKNINGTGTNNITVTGGPITTSGTLTVGVAEGYSIPSNTDLSSWSAKLNAITDLDSIRSKSENGNTAYGWGNHADAGYLTSQYTAKNVVGNSSTGTTDTSSENGSVYLNLIEDNNIRSSHKISGGGSTSVTSDSSGNITISSTGNSYDKATSNSDGLMSADDKAKLDSISYYANDYELPIASSSKLGGVKIGDNINISKDGTISVNTASASSPSTPGLITYDTVVSLVGKNVYETTKSSSFSFRLESGLVAPVKHGDETHIIIYNSSSNIITASFPTSSYTCCNGNSLDISSYSYAEVNLIKIGTTTYLRAAAE